jgi:hypothetical protein
MHGEQQKHRLVLVKGATGSRLLRNALLISVTGRNRAGQPLKILSPAMQGVFGDFEGKVSFQRSPTRWVDSTYVAEASAFVRSLA